MGRYAPDSPGPRRGREAARALPLGLDRPLGLNSKSVRVPALAYPSDSDRPLSAVTLCRRLWPSDGPAVRAYFLRLDPETRASRFMAAMGDRAAVAYADRAMRARGTMFGVFVDGSLRALGELRPFGAERGCAEAALAVERGFRRAGLGSTLLRRLVEAARNRGASELRLRCLPHNAAMRRLAAQCGAELRFDDGESAATVPLARATPLSLWREGLNALLDFSLAAAALPPAPALPPALRRAA